MKQTKSGNLNPPKQADKSGSIPAAQTPGLCGGLTAQERHALTRTAELLESPEVSLVEKMLIELLLVNGLRVSEVLRIVPGSVTWAGNVIIHGSKGSNSRIAHSLRYKEEWLRVRQLKIWDISYINRYRLYRVMKRFDIYTQDRCNVYRSVTHSFRKIYAHSLLNSSSDKGIVSQALGHKSAKSIKYYEPGR